MRTQLSLPPITICCPYKGYCSTKEALGFFSHRILAPLRVHRNFVCRTDLGAGPGWVLPNALGRVDVPRKAWEGISLSLVAGKKEIHEKDFVTSMSPPLFLISNMELNQ